MNALQDPGWVQCTASLCLFWQNRQHVSSSQKTQDTNTQDNTQGTTLIASCSSSRHFVVSSTIFTTSCMASAADNMKKTCCRRHGSSQICRLIAKSIVTSHPLRPALRVLDSLKSFPAATVVECECIDSILRRMIRFIHHCCECFN